MLIYAYLAFMAKDQQTEARILKAAQRVFTRDGMAGARTEDIAAEAGVNRALINYYFRSRDNLARAVFLEAAGAFFPAIMGTLAGEQELEAKIHSAVDLIHDTMSRTPYLPLYVLAELQYHPEKLKSTLRERLAPDERRREAFARLQDQLDREAAAGRIRPTQAIDLQLLLVSLLVFPFAASGMIDVLLGISPTDQEALRLRRKKEMAGFILRGLAPDATAPNSEAS